MEAVKFESMQIQAFEISSLVNLSPEELLVTE